MMLNIKPMKFVLACQAGLDEIVCLLIVDRCLWV